MDTDATHLTCPSSPTENGKPSATHHLTPGPPKGTVMRCTYCGKTRNEILAGKASDDSRV